MIAIHFTNQKPAFTGIHLLTNQKLQYRKAGCVIFRLTNVMVDGAYTEPIESSSSAYIPPMIERGIKYRVLMPLSHTDHYSQR